MMLQSNVIGLAAEERDIGSNCTLWASTRGFSSRAEKPLMRYVNVSFIFYCAMVGTCWDHLLEIMLFLLRVNLRICRGQHTTKFGQGAGWPRIIACLWDTLGYSSFAYAGEVTSTKPEL